MRGGKGFVASHTALTAFDSWPEFGDLLGARYDDHPWNTASGTIINEDPSFPATRHFAGDVPADRRVLPAQGVFARQAARAAAARRLEDAAEPEHAGARTTIFRWRGPRCTARDASSTRRSATRAETWDNRDVAQMYFEAIKWSLGLTEGDATPR